MHCKKCKKEVKPLICHDGELFCPICLGNLFCDDGFQLTAQNVLLYAQSKKLFLQGWLLDKDKKSRDEAIKKCAMSACLKNPYAVFSMGYYTQKKYINPNSSDRESRKNALRYYNSIAVYDKAYRESTNQKPVIDADCLDKDLIKRALQSIARIKQEEQKNNTEIVELDDFLKRLGRFGHLFGLQRVSKDFLLSIQSRMNDKKAYKKKISGLKHKLFVVDNSIKCFELVNANVIDEVLKSKQSDYAMIYINTSINKIRHRALKSAINVELEQALIANKGFYDFLKKDIYADFYKADIIVLSKQLDKTSLKDILSGLSK